MHLSRNHTIAFLAHCTHLSVTANCALHAETRSCRPVAGSFLFYDDNSAGPTSPKRRCSRRSFDLAVSWVSHNNEAGHVDATAAQPPPPGSPSAGASCWSRLPVKLQVAILLQLPPAELLRLAPVSKQVRTACVTQASQHQRTPASPSLLVLNLLCPNLVWRRRWHASCLRCCMSWRSP